MMMTMIIVIIITIIIIAVCHAVVDIVVAETYV